MATASDYLSTTNPINATSDPSRGFSDKIYINFTSGKQSLDEQLKEVELEGQKLALEQAKLLPASSAADEFSWAKAEADRAADQYSFQKQYDAAEEARRQSEELRQQSAARQSKATTKSNLLSQSQSRNLAQSGESRAQSGESRAATESAFNMDLATKKYNQDVASQALATSQTKQAMDLAAQENARATQKVADDKAKEDQLYKDTHMGLTPAQVASSQAFSQSRNAATKNAPVGSPVDVAYMKTLGYYR